MRPPSPSRRCNRTGDSRDNIEAAEGPTICANFDTCRVANYKERVIDLLARVTRVSVETQAIVATMREATR